MKLNPGIVILLLLVLAMPAFPYEYPLTPEAIRDAYMLATSPGATSPKFLSEYRHMIPELKVGTYTSIVWIETPFTRVVDHSRLQLNYSAQDAVKDFLHKPARFHLYLDICYWPVKPEPLKVRVTQNDTAVLPETDEREGYYAVVSDEFTPVQSIGEHIHLAFKPGKITSSDLLIEIETANGQHAQTRFDLRTLK